MCWRAVSEHRFGCLTLAAGNQHRVGHNLVREHRAQRGIPERRGMITDNDKHSRATQVAHSDLRYRPVHIHDQLIPRA